MNWKICWPALAGALKPAKYFALKRSNARNDSNVCGNAYPTLSVGQLDPILDNCELETKLYTNDGTRCTILTSSSAIFRRASRRRSTADLDRLADRMADKLRFLSTQDLLERAYRAIDNSQRILLEFTAKSNALDDRKRNLYLAELEREKEMDPRSDD